MIKFFPKINIAYNIIPFIRNQDVVKIGFDKKKSAIIACVVDGWSNQKILPENEHGRKAAEFVAENFPKKFLQGSLKNPKENAVKTVQYIDERLIKKYPTDAGCVGVFLFSFKDREIIVSVGDALVYVWEKKGWKKPKEIGDYWLDPQSFPSDVSRFFGRGELKKDPLYSNKPDVAIIRPPRFILLTSDGLKHVFSVDELTEFTRRLPIVSPKPFIVALSKKIKIKSGQADDISVLIKVANI